MINNVKLINKEYIANETLKFVFARPDGFDFRAGQFGDLTLINPPETDEEGNTRGFSIASAPYEDNLMFATRLRDSAFKRVLKDLPLGSEVKLDAPYGDYTLHKTASTPAVFIIGGIGVTPVRSMIAQATHQKTSHKITLIHANKTPDDAPFTSDFIQFAKDNPNFRFIPVFSNSDDSQITGAEYGRVNSDMLKKHVEDIHKAIYYLSGPEGMVKAMRQMLVELEVNEDNIKTEEFAGY